MLEEGPRGCHEQEKDSDGMRDAPRLAESTTEATSMTGVLEEQVGADEEGDQVSNNAVSRANDQLGSSNDE